MPSAIITPWCIDSGRYQTLFVAPEPPHAVPRGNTHVRSAYLTLRLLARLQRLGAPWRSTCLTRSVAACLALRHAGVPAILGIGARRSGDSIVAHAWVEHIDGAILAGARDGHTPLRAAS